MIIKTGCDLVYLPKFKLTVARSPNLLFSKLFTQHELAHNSDIVSLAGKFAVKEAVIKAIDHLQAGDWHKIEITHHSSGKPLLKIVDSHQLKIVSSDISISHDGDYIFAVCFFLLGDDDFKSDFRTEQSKVC